MKAVVIKKYGQKPVELVNVEMPNIADDEVLVQIHAASINPIDNKIKEGKLKILLKYKMPLIMGNDFSGVVTEVGKNVTYFKKGDAVYGRPRKNKIGTFAEYIAIHEDELALKPKNLSFEEAASLPLVGLTSYQALHDILKLKKGQKVLIQAGSGGIGTFAIQLAKNMGLYVATTTSEKGVALVTKMGADQIINYKTEKFDEVLKDYDAVFDTLGNQAVKDAFKIVKPGGGIVSITANPNKRFVETYQHIYKFNWLQKIIFKITGMPFDRLEKKYHVTYTMLFMFPSRTQLDLIRDLVEDGRIVPVVDKTYSLEETQKALDYSASGRAKGKIIIKIN